MNVRLRIQRITSPRSALILTDTPRPDCRHCGGLGDIEHPYGHHDTGEYEGSDWEPCCCWNEDLKWVLLPLPRRRPRRTTRSRTGFSDEPPF
ncbi:hypothetical protein ABCR94_06955 [Streptomyces sp. 21So2-11]|uniref:hypothetical protein n=1 Tax=Streptomyces sp. 21So2-11 TaxID=3144408 RepID=UPI00321A0D83